VVICLERSADLHMAQLMPLPLTISCFSTIHIGFTFLVPAHPGSPGQGAVKRDVGVVIATAIPKTPTISCLIKIHTGFTFLENRPLNRCSGSSKY